MTSPTPSIYQGVQVEELALLLAHRIGSAERELISRMLAKHELVRRHVSERLEPVQLTLGDRP